MSHLDAFKAHFEYYDQIYLNTTNWNIQVTYDYSKLENAGTELYEFCRDAPKQLAIIRKEIQSNNVIKKIEGKLSVTPTYDTFYRGKELCSELGPMCRMATIGSQDELHEITKLMRSTNADQAYVDFGTEAGDSYLDGKEPEPTNFLATETVFSTLSCPPGFQPIHTRDSLHDETDCFKIIKKKATRHEQVQACHKAHNSRLYHPRNLVDIEKFDKLLPKGISKEFWLGNRYSFYEKPDVQSCYYSEQAEKVVMRYNWDEHCGLYHPEESGKFPAICHVNGIRRNISYGSQEFFNVLSNHFHNHAGGFTLRRANEGLYFHDAKRKHQSICICEEDSAYHRIRKNYRMNLLDKIDTATKNIKQECKAVMDPIKTSPYIIVNRRDANARTKRIAPIIPIIASAFRAGGPLFNFAKGGLGLASKAPSIVGQTAKVVPKLGVKSRFINTMKKTPWFSTLSTLGLTAMVIDDALEDNTPGSHHIQHMPINANISEEIIKSLRENANAKVSSQKFNMLNTQLTHLNDALHATVQLGAVSARIDKFMIEFKYRSFYVSEQFKAYNSLIDIITSKVFNNPAITAAMLKASKSLPPSFGFLSDNVFEIMETASVTCEVEGTKAVVNLLLPIVHEQGVLCVWKGRPLPYETSDGTAVLPKYEASYIALSSDLDKYALVHLDDLNACRQQDYYMCTNLPMLTSSVRSCMYSHFKNDDIAARDCHFFKLGKKNVFELDSENFLHYYTKEPVKAIVKCWDDNKYDFQDSQTLSGLGKMFVQPGCAVEVNHHYYAFNPKLPDRQITREVFRANVEDANKFLTLPQDTSYLDDIYVPVAPTQSQGSPEDDDELDWTIVECLVYTMLVVVITTALVALFCYFCRKDPKACQDRVLGCLLGDDEDDESTQYTCTNNDPIIRRRSTNTGSRSRLSINNNSARSRNVVEKSNQSGDNRELEVADLLDRLREVEEEDDDLNDTGSTIPPPSIICEERRRNPPRSRRQTICISCEDKVDGPKVEENRKAPSHYCTLPRELPGPPMKSPPTTSPPITPLKFTPLLRTDTSTIQHPSVEDDSHNIPQSLFKQLGLEHDVTPEQMERRTKWQTNAVMELTDKRKPISKTRTESARKLTSKAEKSRDTSL